jgi:SnoaL-like polyketide cyclase
VSIDDLLTDGDRFASRTTVTGTHTGGLMGLPATGKHISVEAVDLGRIENGQAKERWGGLNTYSLLTQLGVIPAPPAELAGARYSTAVWPGSRESAGRPTELGICRLGGLPGGTDRCVVSAGCAGPG